MGGRSRAAVPSESWNSIVPAIQLNAQILRQTLPAGKVKQRIYDAGVTGLIAELRSSLVTFWFRYRDARGRQKEIKIGRHGSITLEQARRKARELAAQVSLGGDPVGEKAAKQAILTLAAYMDREYLPDARQRLRSHRNLVAYADRIKRRLGRKALDEVTWSDISAFKASLVAEGLAPGTVNRHLATLRALYNQAIRSGHHHGPNPAAQPGMLPEQSRECVLHPGQDRDFIAALRDDPNQTAATALGLIFVTGARKSEVTKAEWRNVDFDRGELLVPRSKNGRPRRIPLAPAAVRLLRLQRRRCAAHEQFVFPGNLPGQPIGDLRRIWERTKRAAKLHPEMRIHDLRHSMASRLANAGTPLNEIGAILGHRSLTITSRYAHFQPERLVTTAALASQAWSTTHDIP